MATGDEKKPTAAEKGKDKVVNGDSDKEVKLDKDGKPITDKKDAPKEGMCYRGGVPSVIRSKSLANDMQRSSARRTSSSRTT